MSVARILNELRDGTFQTAEDKFKAMRGGGRPDGYFLADSTRVPSCTTITGRFKNPGGLYHWHWMNGVEGRAFRDGGTPALEIGSIVHDLVEAYVHEGEEAVAKHPKLYEADPEWLPAIRSGYGAFVEWWLGNRFEMVATEVPLVSEEHRFGGTLDCVVRDRRRNLCIADWKTSNSLYPDYLVQIAGYEILWNENAPERLKLTGGFHLVRFAKQHGDFRHQYFPELADARRQFLLWRESYELDKGLEKRCK